MKCLVVGSDAKAGYRDVDFFSHVQTPVYEYINFDAQHVCDNADSSDAAINCMPP